MALMLAVMAAVSGCATANLFDGLWGDDSSTEAAAVTGDAIAPDLATAKQNEAVAKLYNKGLDNLKSGEFKSAAKQFGEVERQYPLFVLGHQGDPHAVLCPLPAQPI